MINTLSRQKHILSDPEYQVSILSDPCQTGVISFKEKLETHNAEKLTTSKPEILQVNLGKMCNQTCKHCHVDAGPDRKEIMSRETMVEVLNALRESPVEIVDLTGGAPELNPDFRWFVAEIKKLKKHIMVRCNLTIILSNPGYNDLPEFFADNKIEVIASLPYFTSIRTDAQRGAGVFEKSIRALQMLNKAGYGMPGSSLILNLVYNPTGAFLPGDQTSLEKEFKRKLLDGYGIQFNNLYTITNLPISRFLDFLIKSGNLEEYMNKLVNSFNPATVKSLMCRNTLSVGWDGYLYDCDFNQMLDLRIKGTESHISRLDWDNFENREIVTNRHCFGCTAGAGSSCGGSLT